MVDSSWVRWRRGVVVGVVALSVVGAGAVGAQEEDPEPNQGDVSVDLGFDVASAYYFRGIAQENAGGVFQPWTDIGFALYEDEDNPINSIDFNIGTWNSLHSRQSGTWYESDFYAALSFGLPAGFSLTTGYTNLYNPAGGGQFAEELNFEVALDDSDLLGPFSLSPFVNFVVETEAGSDGTGSGEGALMIMGVNPSISLDLGNEDYPLDLNMGVEVAFNIDEYYETASGEEDDHTFGYLDLSWGASVPLAFMPKSWGAWSASAAVHLIYIGRSPREIGDTDFGVTGGNAWESYFTTGIAMSY